MNSADDRKPVPILFVLPNLRAGGAERVSIILLSLLDRSRFAPELVVFDGAGEFKDLLPAGIPVHDLSVGRLRSAFRPLLRVIRARRPALVFSSHSYVNLALLAGRGFFPKGTKIVVREPSTPSRSLPDTRFSFLLKLGYWLLFRRADRVICLNREAEDDLLSRYGVDPERLVLLPNPVSVAALRDAAETPVRDPGPGRRLVAAGRLTPAKGFDNLLRVLPSTPGDIFLTIYGDGPEEAALKSLCRALGLDARVRFAGFERQLAPALAGADAVVAPSRWEGFPNVVLETLACGTQVISTPEAGGVRELQAEFPAGAVTLAASQAALIDAICAVRESGHRKIRPSLLPERFDESSVTGLFAATLDKALGNQSGS
jgi:glycosyltransferase involved in cell wall biosynthesis